MDDRDSGPRDLSTGERVASLAGAMSNAMKHKAQGEHETQHGARFSVPLVEAQRIIAGWPDAPRKGAEQMIEQYGTPNEATPTKLFWYHAGPWKRILATSDIVTHNFPLPHSDFLTMWIDYKVPVELVDSITRYDGSCLVDRTAGEAGARCDSEAANMTTLNLMHEIVIGKRSVDEARKVYAENMAGYTMGRPAPYAERLLFPVAQSGTADPDKSNMAGAAVRQTIGKVKDVITGQEHEASDR